MSGGVDSSVAAALLKEEGYDVVGVTLKLYDYSELGFDPPHGGCCSIDLINDARLVCAGLKIPHYVIDLRESFRHNVIENFIDSYSRGRTPNPCVNCNTHIKWGEMIRTADKLGCEFIATGHYARIDHFSHPPKLMKSADPDKDQSYALWGIPPEVLSRTLLPLGNLAKTETREIALKYSFPNAQRPDSQEICFVPAGDYSHIIREKLGDNDDSLQPGPIYDTDGRKLGEHAGYANYTIGQRRGLGIASDAPLYVVKINPHEKSVIVGRQRDLMARQFKAVDLNWLIDLKDVPSQIIVRIRYRHKGSPAELVIENGTALVTFKDPERAITPGQSAVFYDGDQVVGGGIIDHVADSADPTDIGLT